MSQTTRGARTWPNQLDVERQIADGVRRAPSAAQVQVAGQGLFWQVTCAWPGRSMLCSLESDRGICRAYPVERGQRTEAGLLSSEKKTCVCMFSGVQLSVAPWTGPSGSSVHGILQARILEWVATSSSRGPSRPRGVKPRPWHWHMDSLPLAPPGRPKRKHARSESEKEESLASRQTAGQQGV